MSDGVGSEFDDIKRNLVSRDARCASRFLGFSYDDSYVANYLQTVPAGGTFDTRLIESMEAFADLSGLVQVLSGPSVVDFVTNNVDNQQFYRECFLSAQNPSLGHGPCNDRRATTQQQPEVTAVALDHLIASVAQREALSGRVATFDLIGHSLGGFVITYWAATRLCGSGWTSAAALAGVSYQDAACTAVSPVAPRQVRHVLAIEAPIMGRPGAFVGGICDLAAKVFETIDLLSDAAVGAIVSLVLGPRYVDVVKHVVDIYEFASDPTGTVIGNLERSFATMCRHYIASWLDPLSNQTVAVVNSAVENRVVLDIIRSEDDQIVLASHATLLENPCNALENLLDIFRSALLSRTPCVRGSSVAIETAGVAEPPRVATGIPSWRDYHYRGGFSGWDSTDPNHAPCTSPSLGPISVPVQMACGLASHAIYPAASDAAAAMLDQHFLSVGATESYGAHQASWRANEFPATTATCAVRWDSIQTVDGGACGSLQVSPTVHRSLATSLAVRR